MDELEPYVCIIQAPPVISTISFTQKWGVQRKTIEKYVHLSLARLEHDNQQ